MRRSVKMFEDLIKPKPRVETGAKKAADPNQPQFWYDCNRCGKSIKVGYKCGDCNPPPTSGTSGKGKLTITTSKQPKDPNPPKPDPAPQGSTTKGKCTCDPDESDDSCDICGGAGGFPDEPDQGC